MLVNFLSKEYEKLSIVNLEKIRNKTIFITGSNGLIGGNILSYLTYVNIKYSLNIKIIAHSFSQPEVWLPKYDFINYLFGNLRELDIDFSFDYLIHAATYSQPRRFMENFLQTIDLNVMIYSNLLELSKLNNASVLYFSSSEVYGDSYGVLKENSISNVNINNIRNIYSESKRLGETISQIYKNNGVDIKIVRPAISYGPGIKLDDKRFLNEFINKALDFREIKLLDSGSAVRQMTFITDVVEMCINVLLGGYSSTYNVCGLSDCSSCKSIVEIAKLVANSLCCNIDAPNTHDEVAPKSLILSSSTYMNEFGKKDFVSLQEGIDKTIEWVKLLRRNRV